MHRKITQNNTQDNTIKISLPLFDIIKRGQRLEKSGSSGEVGRGGEAGGGTHAANGGPEAGSG